MPRTRRPAIYYLIRHGETTWNQGSRIQGHADPPLSARGRRQVLALGRRLARERPDRFVTSDLRRARDTAALLNRFCRVPLDVLPGLREIHLGAWEGLTPDEVDRRFRGGHARWRAGPSRVQIPGAEPIPAFRRRVWRCWQALLQTPGGARTVIVTHGGVIATIVASILRLSFDAILVTMPIANASVTTVVAWPDRMTIEVVGARGAAW